MNLLSKATTAATAALLIYAPVAAQTFPQPPLPSTMSAEARAILSAADAAAGAKAATATTLPPISEMRALTDAQQRKLGVAQAASYGVKVTRTTWAGVPVLVFEPREIRADRKRSLLINFHGGGFIVDAGSMTENVRLAALSGTRIVSVLYRLAPEHPFPAAVDDGLAVYRHALTLHRPADIAVYGTSAGAILTAELLARLRKEVLPMPAAAGTFSLTADFTRAGDSEGYLPPLMGAGVNQVLSAYAGDTKRSDPLMSPLFSDLRGLPPTLVLASTRDQLLSQSAIYHRALLRAGVEADLIVYEGLPHAFWTGLEIPESTEAFAAMNAFLDRHLGRAPAKQVRSPERRGGARPAPVR